MSSFIGHAAAGATVYLSQSRLTARHAKWALPTFVLLAISPDLDYFPLWLWDVSAHPRWTHSIVFCLGVSLVAWFATRNWRARTWPELGFLAFAIATCSHLILDVLVGVHPVALFWPLPWAEVSSPVGVLPSAGHLRLNNYYLWRNLLIECGVLFPVFAIIIAIGRKVSLRKHLALAMILGIVWGAFTAWSLAIHR